MGTRLTLEIINESNVANSNATSGSGIYLNGGLTTIGPGVKVEHNNASTGGGVFLTKPCSSCTAFLTISPDARISNNIASLAGGGLYKDSDLSTTSDADARKAMTKNRAFFGADLLTDQCVTGEVLKGEWCERCGNNLYSLNPNKPACGNCPLNGHCFGGAVVIPRNDSWQPTPNGSQSSNCSLTDIAR